MIINDKNTDFRLHFLQHRTDAPSNVSRHAAATLGPWGSGGGSGATTSTRVPCPGALRTFNSAEMLSARFLIPTKPKPFDFPLAVNPTPFFHGEPDHSFFAIDLDPDLGGIGVTNGVRDRLLPDAEERVFYSQGNRGDVSLTRNHHAHSAALDHFARVRTRESEAAPRSRDSGRNIAMSSRFFIAGCASSDARSSC